VNLFEFVSRYFWVVCLAMSLFNYLAAHRRISTPGTIDIDHIEAAKLYMNRFALANSIPWLIMGCGQTFGHVPTIWYYFRPQDGNPYVIGWFASIFVLWIFFCLWVLFAEGAKKVKELHLMMVLGMRNKITVSENMIKLFAALGPVFFVIWIGIVVSMNAPIPH
jgi:hypothetical protein